MLGYKSLVNFSLWFAYSCRIRSLNSFVRLNPDINEGGMFCDRKSLIYDLLPKELLPKTLLLRGAISRARLKDDLLKRRLSYPLFIKPDIGFRGFMAERVDDENELLEHLLKRRGKDFLIQEFVDLPKEFSVLYYRCPISREEGILSFSERFYPEIMGDGKSRISELITRNSNRRLNKKKLLTRFYGRLNEVLEKDESLVVDWVGNFVRGSDVKSLNHRIDGELVKAFSNVICKKSKLHFVRFDVKASSISELKRGNFIILEMNGAKSESIHLYDDRYSSIEQLRELNNHWKVYSRVARECRVEYDMPQSILMSLSSYFKLMYKVHLEGRFSIKKPITRSL